ncbi:response regulator [Spirosoma foliorum]|uniref:Response regulator n=1 Tax=Spirosoma foliorum TaxID=2710596 RepID=A0A7G5GYT3_9BACT|nr:response regulator [Spirosoma foliorum]QMW04025.1 response regulator [Spirosoma foliorum]
MVDNETFEILVVEDDQPTFDLLHRLGDMLFPEATFVRATSPEETLHYLSDSVSKRPQLILLDINLHQPTDGLTMLPELRTRFQGQVPIIMMTVSDSPAHVRQAYQTGATAFTIKPADLGGWKEYIEMLKTYWYEINLLPPTQFPPFRFLLQ